MVWACAGAEGHRNEIPSGWVPEQSLAGPVPLPAFLSRYGRQEQVRKILEVMGVASARAQGSALGFVDQLEHSRRFRWKYWWSRVFWVVRVV